MRRMFSEEQLKKLAKATFENQDIQVNGITATGDIAGKTLSQSEANWSAEFEFNADEVGNENLDVENKYCRLEVINNILYLVAVVKYANNTENNMAVSTSIKDIILPEKIGRQIIDYNGKNLTEEAYADISADVLFTGEAGHSPITTRNVSFRHQGANKFRILFVLPTALQANNYEVFTFRSFITLI